MSGSRARRPDRARDLLLLAAATTVFGGAVLLVLLGLDAASIILGGALVAASFAIAIVTLTRSADRGRQASERRLRSLRAASRADHARTRSSVDAAERRLFAQLEAMGWLHQLLRLEHPLLPTRGWASAPDLLVEIVRVIDRARPARVLELGSGVSTIVIAARLKALGTGTVTAIEHEPSYAEQTRQELALQGLDDVATVVDAPLGVIRVGEADWTWYRLPLERLPAGVGLLLVDGPPGTTGPLARYPALPVLADVLAPGAIVLVDDADRPDEQEIVRRWQAEIQGLDARHLGLECGAFRLTLPAA